jgi:hypothetical protein
VTPVESLSAPEFKYTDRHVREDIHLRETAEGYTSTYGGDFEPMINAKYELARTGRLETRTARVVLNCMRYDQSVSLMLPVPTTPTLEVVQGGGGRAKAAVTPFCLDPRPHWQHSEQRGRGYVHCKGVPWPINRSGFGTPARIRPRYAAAHMSPIYHLTSGLGSVGWRPPAHRMGPAEVVGLWVYLVCKYPSKLVDPLLFVEEPTHLVSTVKQHPGQRTLCRHCVKVLEDGRG